MQKVEDTIEVRALAEASPMDSIRFLLDTETWTDDPDQKSNDDSSSLASAGEKVDHELDLKILASLYMLTNMFHLQRKLDALESGTKSWATNQKKEVLWRVNFEEFVRRLRHKVSFCLAVSSEHTSDNYCLLSKSFKTVINCLYRLVHLVFCTVVRL